MMRTNDPRIRQTLNQISHNLESANETAQEGFYAFSHDYLAPCFASVGNCLRQCTEPCLPSRRDTHLRRRRRGRAEENFDFYDDWDNDDETDGLLGWGTDELDRLLAGSGGRSRGGSSAQQPRRQRKMSYGAARARRRSSVLPDQRNDPTVIPKSSILGFLERLPWQFGRRGVKYRPSAADLQERPGRLSHDEDYETHDGLEAQPLIEEGEDEESDSARAPTTLTTKKQRRIRSITQSSQETTNSLSSRGDLIFDDEDDEDAVPLDEEFAVVLARRSTGLTSDDHLAGSGGRSRRTTSGYSSRDSKGGRGRERRESKPDAEPVPTEEFPSMAELAKEEQAAENEEEQEISRKRRAAQQLAMTQGLIRDEPGPTSGSTSPNMSRSNPSSIHDSDEPTEPFPSLPVTPTSQTFNPLVVADQPAEAMAEHEADTRHDPTV